MNGKTCRAMMKQPPHYECELPPGHKGKHAAFVGQIRARVVWTDAECLSEAEAAAERERDER